MIIQKPIAAIPSPHNRYETVLHFERGERVKFYLRGAIAWPEGDDEGFAFMAGQRVQDKVIFIFDQFRWQTVSPWTTPGGEIRRREDGSYHVGLIQFVLDCNTVYKCNSFFFGGQHVDIVKRWSIDLYRHPMLPRQIELIEVPYVKEIGDDLIIEKLQTQGFFGQVDSPLARSTERWVNMRSADVGSDNAVHALRALLCGFEHQPFVSLSGR